MPKRSEHSLDEIRSMALDAVESLVASQGLAGVSARKVAAEIGYTVGMLYHVFDNIDDLILQANARLVSRLVQQCEQAAGGRSADKAVARMAGAYLDLALTEPAHWRLVFDHAMQAGRPVPDWYQTMTGRLFELVEAELQRLAPRRRSHQVRLAARALWSAVHGICQLMVTDKLDIGGDVDARQTLDSLLVHFLAGWKQ